MMISLVWAFFHWRFGQSSDFAKGLLSDYEASREIKVGTT